MVSNVTTGRMVEPFVNRFLRHGNVGRDFRGDVNDMVNQLATSTSERIYLALLCMSAKFAAETAPFQLKKSEKIKRKV